MIILELEYMLYIFQSFYKNNISQNEISILLNNNFTNKQCKKGKNVLIKIIFLISIKNNIINILVKLKK